MNTTGVIVMQVDHLTQVRHQTMQLLGAYREQLPVSPVMRAALMNACAALSNATLAAATDQEEWEDARRAQHYRTRHWTELVGIIEDASTALAGRVLGPK